MKNILISVSIILTVLFEGSESQTPHYEATYSSTKLPMALGGQRAFYDGSNTVYLFGGFNGGSVFPTEILRYNILTDTLEQVVGVALPTYAVGFTMQQNRDGDIFILGAGGGNNFIFKFRPGSNTIETLGTLPYDIYRSGSVKYYDISNNLFIFGGYQTADRAKILEYDMVKNTAEPKGRLPRNFAANDAVRIGNYAYIFGQSDNDPLRGSLLKVNLDDWEIQTGPGNLPPSSFYSSLVTDGKSIFACGGYYPNNDFPMGGLIHIDPATLNSTFIPVDNFPTNDMMAWSPTSVYIERFNKIYFFGGLGSNAVGLDGIWWINL